MSTLSITDWSTWLPATPITGRVNYNVTLPVFNAATPSWKGASEIVLQYNYTASRNFYLTQRPAKPAGVNYGLCIRYRVGNTVYRYKLWEDDNLILGEVAAPLYNSEIIKANFVLEIWSLEGEAAVTQASALTLFTSLRSSVTDLRDNTAVALAYSELLTYADLTVGDSGIVIDPITPDLSWYRGDSMVAVGNLMTSWDDKTINARDINIIAGQGIVVTGAAVFNLKTYLLPSTNFGVSGFGLYGPANYSYFVFQLSAAFNNNYLIAILPCGTRLTQISPQHTIKFDSALVAGGQNIEIGLEQDVTYVVKTHVFADAGATKTVVTVYKLNSLEVVAEGTYTSSGGLRSANSGYFAVGDGATTAVVRITECQAYDSAPNNMQILSYMNQYYTGSVSFETSGTFNVGNMWEDNV